ncbi:ATP-binding cassette domain-containing protein [Corynebacterium sphenisci]|uniref:ATP-binding cassette domain-containing protein n=1 Tax=Corynebacterium sphenisci TaxID=191493 RepID=UPI0026E056F1|nr:ATP-binding cassette domain-containing protein [Corynebacterium sphenisci]MDO5730547.1 ATP-binding cassette domain-containing protein [Corynebacterium sphenisci]
MIRITDLRYGFGRRIVLDEVTAEFPAGAVAALTGVSASGKSTLLNLIGALDRPAAGSIIAEHGADRVEVTALPARRRARYRREWLGYLFQDYALVPERDARWNIALAAPRAPRGGGAAPPPTGPWPRWARPGSGPGRCMSSPAGSGSGWRWPGC